MGFGDDFLTEPALFPGRLAGSPAGEGTLVVDVAGGPYRFVGLGPVQLETLRERYGERCLDPETAAAVEISMFAAEPDEFLPRLLDGRPNRYDFDHSESSIRIAGYRVMARIEWRPALRAAIWTPEEEGQTFGELLENCFRFVVAYRLLDCGGAALHSSAMVVDDEAWVFYGQSGAGKTTIARRAQAAGRTVLSDDLNAVFVESSLPQVAKLPFAGELGHTNERVGPFPLAGLGRLEQAPTESWQPMSTASAVSSMVACAPFINGDSYRLHTLLDNLEKIARAVDRGTLGFTLEGDFWPVLEGRA